MKGKTKSGFEFEINLDVFNDMELLENLSAMSAEQPFVLPKVVKQILGSEQKARLYDHIREPDGRVPVDKMNEELTEIFEAAGTKGKNF